MGLTITAYAILGLACMGSGSRTQDVFALTPNVALSPAAREACRWLEKSDRFAGDAIELAPERSVELLEEARPLPVPGQYRIEAWVMTEDGGEGHIDVVLLDEDTGAERETYTIRLPQTPVEGVDHRSALDGVPPTSTDDGAISMGIGPFTCLRRGWRYVARDIPLERETGALRFNIRLSTGNKAVRFDGLKVSGTRSILLNGDFSDPEPAAFDDQSIPRGWRRAYEFADRAHEAEGAFSIKDAPQGGGLSIQKSVGSFVLSALPLDKPANAEALVARAYVDGPSEQAPGIIVRQYGAHGLLRTDASEQVSDLGGVLVVTTRRVELDPHATRILFLLSFPNQAGSYRLRAAELVPLAPKNIQPRIVVDQVGYDVGEPMRFVVATEVFPTDGDASFSLVDDKGTRFAGSLVALGRVEGQDGSDWGGYYFEGVAPETPDGLYTVQAKLGSSEESVEGLVVDRHRRLRETGELAYRFYSIQRCGCEVPGWHGPCHMDDGRLPNGTHVDVTGGYHNAGDFHKHTGDNTPVSVYAMAALYEQLKSYYDTIDRDGSGQSDLLDEALWGAEWLLKMVDPETGQMWMNVTNDIDYYGIPEHDTDGIVGTGDDRLIGTGDPYNLGAFSIAGWAVLARLLPDSPYRQAAERLWDVYEQKILAGSDPRHIIAAVELYGTTHDSRYRDAADRLVAQVLARQGSQGWFASTPGGGPVFRIVDEGTAPAALARYVLTWPEADLAPRVRKALTGYFQWSLALGDNPFGVIRHCAGGEPFYFKSREEWYGGSNSAYSSTAWAAYLAARVFRDDPDIRRRLLLHAANQVHWVLGMNPLSLCMFAGKGNSDRIKFHHLYAEIPGHPRGAVPGAIPNGIIRGPDNQDRPWFDFRQEKGTLPGAESAEPWLPHNAYFLLMLAAQDDALSNND